MVKPRYSRLDTNDAEAEAEADAFENGMRPRRGSTQCTTDARCARHLSTWSPALEAVEYVDVEFQNAFHQPSIYRGAPNEEREKSWFDLWNFGNLNVPLDKLVLLNKSTATDWIRVPPEHGGGVSGAIEVFHQIHCLDLIRQYTYRHEYDYSKTPAFDAEPHMVRAHIDHCIETIRMYLMCVGDVTPYLMISAPSRPLGELPDFNTKHKCRNYTKLQEWMRENTIPGSSENQ
ncbi:hypothetical protein BDV26DRAFT_284484 [Aspergillus bertholletiae]|uniref:Cyclochlorotine biosynthesis protein O n=1 Tax=Aspergillus bertholletiae TaxID=1226010 RepID=A0A5N7AZ69_9EURO|nr:hypothetical protein BDV26DRAFT_284484 [Aspergillus bertholletiae]